RRAHARRGARDRGRAGPVRELRGADERSALDVRGAREVNLPPCPLRRPRRRGNMSIGSATAAACAAVVGLAGVLATGAGGAAAPARRDARALVRAPAFDRAIDALEHVEPWSDLDEFDAVLERRREAADRLARDVLAGGDELVDAAVDLVIAGDDED